MNQPEDVVLVESLNVTGETVGGGIYSGQSINGDANVWMSFAGFVSAVNLLETGNRFPIDTSVYRNFSVKVRMSGPGIQVFQVLYFEDETSIVKRGTLARACSSMFNPNEWTILSFDLQTQSFAAGPSGSSFVWQDRPLIQGLRVDPSAQTGVTYEIDWIRLTPAPTGGNTATTVSWSGNVGSVDIFAVDAMGTDLLLASGVGGSSISVDFTALPPGKLLRSGLRMRSAPTLHRDRSSSTAHPNSISCSPTPPETPQTTTPRRSLAIRGILPMPPTWIRFPHFAI